MNKYKVVRFYKNARSNRTMQRGLTLAEAQAHCQDIETSGSTCTTAAAKLYTAQVGDWFDGYEIEGETR